MTKQPWLAAQFEANRAHLQAVAYRILASASEADDAVQEAWLRLHRSDPDSIENLRGWLTTVVARVSLDMLRARAARREEAMEAHRPELERTAGPNPESDPEYETLLADSVGIAMLVVLDRLAPAERLAFVLHDMFAVPFDEIAPIVRRSPTATRQLASRARRRVQGSPAQGSLARPSADFIQRRQVADAFLAASRDGNFDALLAVLDADVVLRADASATPPHGREVRGATNVARGAVAGRAANFSPQGQFAQLALIDGRPGIVVAPQGRLRLVLALKIASAKITEIDLIADPARLRQLKLALL